MRDEPGSQRSPLAFLALVVVLAVPFWALGELVETPEDFPVRLPPSALLLVCPIIAAALLRYREDGSAGVRRLLARTVSPRGIGPRWLAVVVLLAPTIWVLSYALQALLGRPLSAPQVPLVDLAVLFALFFISGIAEETGWTGYATDPLRERWGALAAALAIGFVWGFVHIIPDLQGGHDPGWIFWQHVVGALALRVLLVWAYQNTGRAVLSAVLIHAIDNLSWQVFETVAPYDPAVNASLLALAAAFVAYAWGPATLARFRYAGGRAVPHAGGS